MAFIPGFWSFDWLGLSGSLGALVMGLILAQRPGADELSHNLFTLKELLLVAFFVNLGFRGMPPWHNLEVGPSLVLLSFSAAAYWFVFWLLGLQQTATGCCPARCGRTTRSSRRLSRHSGWTRGG